MWVLWYNSETVTEEGFYRMEGG